MNIIKCYDVVSMIITEATERFKPLWKINTEKQDVLKEYCEAIDEIAAEFEGVSFNVEVNEITMEVKIDVECGEIVIKSKEHRLYDLAERATRFGVSAIDGETQVVKFVFPSIWDKVKYYKHYLG